MELGEKIAKARKHVGLTQAALAEKVGVSSEAVSKWESGAYLPGPDKMARLEEELHLSCYDDEGEPMRLAQAAKSLGLRHVVVTTVTRDDLPDGGAAHFARVIRALREVCPGTTVEVLISDLKGDKAALDTVIDARPDVLNHNVETV